MNPLILILDGDAFNTTAPLGAAQLAQHVIRLRPDDSEPKLLMADALDIIGERTFFLQSSRSDMPI